MLSGYEFSWIIDGCTDRTVKHFVTLILSSLRQYIPTQICVPIFREHWYKSCNPDENLPVFPKNGNTGLAKLPAIDPNFVTLVQFLDLE